MRFATVIVALVISTAAFAADKNCESNMLGRGAETTCGAWFNARTRGDDREVHALVEWAAGYFTARNLYVAGKTPRLENDTLATLIDEQCRLRPELRFDGAVHNAMIKVGGPTGPPVCKDR